MCATYYVRLFAEAFNSKKITGVVENVNYRRAIISTFSKPSTMSGLVTSKSSGQKCHLLVVFENSSASFQNLQAPACHENMVKVGGYILGEFGNLIAGDSRSSPLIQFNLLHSKFHLCSPATRALLLSTYIKFVNLFPEIKPTIQVSV